METFLAVLLVLSVCLNLFLAYLFRKHQKEPAARGNATAEQIIGDLLHGRGHSLVRIERIAPAEYFVRRP